MPRRPMQILAPKTIGQSDLQACTDIGEALGQGLVMGVPASVGRAIIHAC